MNISNYIKRETGMFDEDVINLSEDLKIKIQSSRFLILGGGGSIGQAVTKEIFKRGPKKLHVVDINENSLTELIRDLRSSYGYIDGDFQVYVLDIGSFEYNALDKPEVIKMDKVGQIHVTYDNYGDIKRVESKAGHKMAMQVTQAFQNLLAIVKPAGVNLNM